MESIYATGIIELPPGAIKDSEGVGACAQIYFIAECQENSIELGIADPNHQEWVDNLAQKQILTRGDSFYIQPGNIYR